MFLELVHGRRATVIHPDGDAGLRPILEALLDPAIRVVAVVAHGNWDGVSFRGYHVAPDRAWTLLATRLGADPAGTLKNLAADRLYPFFRPDWRNDRLDEAQLATLWSQWWPEPAARAAAAKDLVVRHTCGTRRYDTDADLLWTLLPDDLAEAIEVDGRAIATAAPGSAGQWESAVEDWLDGRAVAIEESVAWGTCLVRDPTDTRGYDGLSWIADFVEDPIPRWMPTHAFAGRLDALSWLEGCWRTEDGREECWTREDHRLTGVARAGDQVVEVLSIENDGGLRYVAAPKGQSPASFALVQRSPSHARFANPAHDFPKWIDYRREGDRLTVSIGTEDDPAATWDFVFTM